MKSTFEAVMEWLAVIFLFLGLLFLIVCLVANPDETYYERINAECLVEKDKDRSLFHKDVTRRTIYCKAPGVLG